jgi:aminomethyltransferase
MRLSSVDTSSVDKKTPLYDEHVKAGARMVPFAGFLMPLQYSGIIEEHRAVRQSMGLFDLSHMGEFRVTGDRALEEVDRLVTNDINGLRQGQIRYTPMCYSDGGIVDDVLVYRGADHLMLVVNASNISKDLSWVLEHIAGGVRVEDISDQTALVAIQGPAAAGFVQALTDANIGQLEYYHFVNGSVSGTDAIISRTGYTGEDGFELYVSPDQVVDLWQSFLKNGSELGLSPAGLGARDTLRLEAGYMLYGNDIDQTTTPLEAGLGWTVKFAKHEFIGRASLEQQKEEGIQRRMMALEMLGRGIPRPHASILLDGRDIGELTSGTFSPTFNRGIGLGYVQSDAKPGTEVNVAIRGQLLRARLARKPLYEARRERSRADQGDAGRVPSETEVRRE